MLSRYVRGAPKGKTAWAKKQMGPTDMDVLKCERMRILSLLGSAGEYREYRCIVVFAQYGIGR